MEYVEAIKDRGKIKEIKKILYNRSKRDYLLFTLGVNTGLKISDMLIIKIGELISTEKRVHDFLYLDENKKNSFYLNEQVKQAITEYIKTIDYDSPEEYIFKSKKAIILSQGNRHIALLIL